MNTIEFRNIKIGQRFRYIDENNPYPKYIYERVSNSTGPGSRNAINVNYGFKTFFWEHSTVLPLEETIQKILKQEDD